MASCNSGLHGNIYKTLCSWKNNDVDAFNYSVEKARNNVMEFCLSSVDDGGSKQMITSEIAKQSFVLNLMDDTCRSILRFLIYFVIYLKLSMLLELCISLRNDFRFE